ncbi:hypothetical protein ABIB40_003735 [Pedobacter sp. UYP30]|uniref:hypothetical protein n=1 Tax=Pedobacter sp. UYP30 TaxID=1756400 RepID=UPI0033978FEB
MEETSLLKKIATCLIFGLTLAALWLSIGNGGTISWLPPTLIFSLVGLSIYFRSFAPLYGIV